MERGRGGWKLQQSTSCSRGRCRVLHGRETCSCLDLTTTGPAARGAAGWNGSLWSSQQQPVRNTSARARGDKIAIYSVLWRFLPHLFPIIVRSCCAKLDRLLTVRNVMEEIHYFCNTHTDRDTYRHTFGFTRIQMQTHTCSRGAPIVQWRANTKCFFFCSDAQFISAVTLVPRRHARHTKQTPLLYATHTKLRRQ